jgi:hypothetical protein
MEDVVFVVCDTLIDETSRIEKVALKDIEIMQGETIPLDKVKQAKEEISKSCYKACITDDGVIRESKVLEILDKLIESEG